MRILDEIGMRMKGFVFLVNFFLEMDLYAQSDSVEIEPTGFIDLNAYYDTRNEIDANINLFSTLGQHLSYFSFINFSGHSNALDTDGYYSEQNLIYQPFLKVPIKIDLQGVFKSGSANDLVRIGLRWQLTKTKLWSDFFNKIGFNYFVTLFGSQMTFDKEHSWLPQLQHVYRFNFLKGRIYLGGFIDQNLNLFTSDRMTYVSEHQLGIRVFKSFYLVSEYRYNDFLTRKSGLGIGAEYKINF